MSKAIPLNSTQDDMKTKVCEFARAIEKYNTSSIYTQFENLLSTKVVLFQIASLINLVLDANLNLGLVSFGILSSVAELSHYWCDSAKTNAFISFLQKYRILLSLKHHRHHHIQDNRNYAFLNGASDPLLNIIAHTLIKENTNYVVPAQAGIHP